VAATTEIGELGNVKPVKGEACGIFK